MMFVYEPLTEEQCLSERKSLFLDPGIYNFEVLDSQGKVSSSGNPMIELKLKVWDINGREHLLFDYIIGTKTMAWKTKHFCDAIGLSREYSVGDFNEHLCQGRSGKVSIKYQKGKPDQKGGFYKDKNVVEDYIPRTYLTVEDYIPRTYLTNAEPDQTKTEDPFNDEIPF